ncbi:ABC transporter substrate-binding protein [Actinophytocola oryzae]|uniref:Carbohydrate ABC transporter substrate-binding protein (CUT1 family) n=1 Tax=Actinophytocola oryzae TaxID=502181 RepID=A0A4R7W5K4_9PSEU|nr:extracellular solute-binding protein [Actinophytocola oryzae]TDV57862.1 carbohydrate ABC transporter substrate-binding protein (CUT1 family) [Actinophytocola oryzae]
MHRRSALALCAALAVVTSACSAGGEGGDVALTFMTFETPALTAKFWDTSIDTALEEVDGVTVEKIVTPDADRNAYAKQLQASGQFPDVLASINPKDFTEAGLLSPFDEDWLAENFVDPGANDIDGKTYIPPTNPQVLPLVFYDKKAFAQHNIAVPSTWDEFMSTVATLKDAGVTPIEFAGLEGWSASMPLVALASADVLGENPDWIQQRYAGTVKFTDPEFVHAMDKARDLVEAGAYASGALSVDYATANKNFLDHHSGMYLMGSWLIGQIPADEADDFGAFPLPTEDGKTVLPFNVGGTTSVSTQGADPAKAMDFAKAWSLAPANLKVLIETDGAFPMLKNKSIGDFGAKVTPLYTECYTLASADHDKVSAFGWVNNDDALPPGVNDLFYALSQQLFANGDVKGQLAQLDSDWDSAAGQ